MVIYQWFLVLGTYSCGYVGIEQSWLRWKLFVYELIRALQLAAAHTRMLLVVKKNISKDDQYLNTDVIEKKTLFIYAYAVIHQYPLFFTWCLHRLVDVIYQGIMSLRAVGMSPTSTLSLGDDENSNQPIEIKELTDSDSMYGLEHYYFI